MNPVTESAFRNELMNAAKRLGRRDFFTFSNFGSVSFRDPESGNVYITPAKTDVYNIKDWKFLRAEDIICVDAEGNPQQKYCAEPSLELALHLAIYRDRPEMNAVAHIYSKHVSAMAATGQDMLPVMVEDVKTEIGGADGVVRCVDFEPIGGEKYVDTVLHGLRDGKKAVFLSNNGAVLMEKNMVELIGICEILERQAIMEVYATPLGNIDRIDIEMTIDESIRPIRKRA